MVSTGQDNASQQCQCSFETAVRKICCTQIRPAFHTLVGRFSRMGLPSNGSSNNHWALSVSITIPRRHRKQRPDSSYEGEESAQRQPSFWTSLSLMSSPKELQRLVILNYKDANGEELVGLALELVEESNGGVQVQVLRDSNVVSCVSVVPLKECRVDDLHECDCCE